MYFYTHIVISVGWINEEIKRLCLCLILNSTIHLNIRSNKWTLLPAYTTCAVNFIHTGTQSCILPLK